MFKEKAEQLLAFIDKSPSCYHAVDNMKKELTNAGFEEVLEGQAWNLKEGRAYYVIRNQSSLIAFKIPRKSFVNFQITASHSDSPTFKIKENAELETDRNYTRLQVEKYGGMLFAPWMDRPLSVAGRAVVREGDRIVSKLVNIDRDLVLIPNMAIHINREVNKGYVYNSQADLLPLWGDETAKGSFLKMIAEQISTEEKDILSTDLFLYNRVKGSIWGANKEYLSAQRLDDLQCAYSCLQGFLEGGNPNSVSVLCVFDNEEVGSSTKQGANSTFLFDTLERIYTDMQRSKEEYKMAIASSFMISADNAHAVHPNHGEKADLINRPYMNKGIVVKYNTNYATDAVSAAVFKTICEKAEVPYQVFTNPSDMPCGSTLGNILNTQVSLNTVDIGLAQLAMHSPYETAGMKDTYYLIQAVKKFYECCIQEVASGEYRVLF